MVLMQWVIAADISSQSTAKRQRWHHKASCAESPLAGPGGHLFSLCSFNKMNGFHQIATWHFQ
jgi:hypothetical protein